MRLSMFESADTEKGFTLVEILVSLVILLLIITACVPLFTLAIQTTHSNKAKTIAAELAKQELEETLAQVTPNNYNNEDPAAAGGAPLQVGVTGPYYRMLSDGVTVDPRYAGYQIRKIVLWIDDPADGLHPADTLPFDYKQLTIEVSSPSVFTGAVTRQADFKSYLAREGTPSAVAGLIVNVVRGWRDDNGNTIPVEGAYVTITSGLDTDSTLTNEFGQAMFPISFSDDAGTSRIYTVEAVDSGLMMHPNPSHLNTVTVTRFSTNSIDIEMEEPGSITVQVTPQHKGAVVRLSNSDLLVDQGGSLSADLAPGDTSVTFSNLWPVGVSGAAGGYPGQYSLSVSDMVAAQFDTAEYSDADWECWKPDEEDNGIFTKNLWLFKSSPGLWEANTDNYTEVDYHTGEHEHRLAYKSIDLSSFAPGSDMQCEVRITPDPAKLAMEAGSESSDFEVIFKSRDNADLGGNSGTWLTVMTVDDLEKMKTDGIGTIDLEVEDMVEQFRLRFDSSLDIDHLTFGSFDIQCTYTNNNVQFSAPGQHLTAKVNGI